MQELPVINRTQELYENVNPITQKLPALKQQTIGRRLENGILDVLELLIMAKYARGFETQAFHSMLLVCRSSEDSLRTGVPFVICNL